MQHKDKHKSRNYILPSVFWSLGFICSPRTDYCCWRSLNVTFNFNVQDATINVMLYIVLKEEALFLVLQITRRQVHFIQ